MLKTIGKNIILELSDKNEYEKINYYSSSDAIGFK